VILWLAGLAVMTAVGINLLPGPGFVWFLAASCVMVLVGRWWDRRGEG
jgi:hypothetical protein